MSNYFKRQFVLKVKSESSENDWMDKEMLQGKT